MLIAQWNVLRHDYMDSGMKIALHQACRYLGMPLFFYF